MLPRDGVGQTIILPLHPNRAVFDLERGWWQFDDGTSLTFSDLGSDRADLCIDFIRQLLIAKFITHVEWSQQEGHKGTELKGVVFKVRAALTQLPGSSGLLLDDDRKGFIFTRRSGVRTRSGYALNPDYIGTPTNSPVRVTYSSLDPLRRNSQPTLPHLATFERLVSNVAKGNSVRLRLLPGTGVDRVADMLAVPKVRVVPIGLGRIQSPDELLGFIRDSALRTESSPVNPTPLAIARAIAESIATSAERLIFVVFGWGAHLRNRNRKSLNALAATLDTFSHVPRTQFVLVSSVSIYHILASTGRVGSFSFLHGVVVDPADSDTTTINGWARSTLNQRPQEAVDQVLNLANGQLEAVLDAVQHWETRSLAERIRGVYDSHALAGDLILADLAPCCYEFLTASRKRPECGRALVDAGILHPDDGSEVRLRIPDWARNWPTRKRT